VDVDRDTDFKALRKNPCILESKASAGVGKMVTRIGKIAKLNVSRVSEGGEVGKVVQNILPKAMKNITSVKLIAMKKLRNCLKQAYSAA
jgi:hypothetical protein